MEIKFVFPTAVMLAFYLMENNDKQVSMGASENGNVNWHCCCVGLVQPYTKIPFATQQEKNEDSDVNESHTTLVSSGLI